MAELLTPPAEWALYVYFGANVSPASVRKAAIENLLQLARVGSSKHVRVAAQLHLPSRWTRRYILGERPPGCGPLILAPAETIPNENAADPCTLVRFFEWAKDHCPAKKVMLVLWGHGYGLDDYLPEGARPHPEHLKHSKRDLSHCDPELDALIAEERQAEKAVAVAEQDRNSEEIAKAELELDEAEDALLFRTLEYNLQAVILSEPRGQVLPNAQVGEAIRQCRKILTGGCEPTNPDTPDLKILALDACAMALAEVWFEMYGCADIGIASEAQEPDASFPYDRFLARLILETDAAAKRKKAVESEVVAKMMIDAYVESYAHSKCDFVTLSALNLKGSGCDPLPRKCDSSPPECDPKKSRIDPAKSALENLRACVCHLVHALKHAAEDCDKREILYQARNDCPIFDSDGFIDLGRFCEILQVTMPYSTVSCECAEVRRALDAFVLYARYSPLDPTLRISQSTGLSVWFPPWLESPSAKLPEKWASVLFLGVGYPLTSFACSTHWDEFLESLRAPR